jgi:hypothetical protein
MGPAGGGLMPVVRFQFSITTRHSSALIWLLSNLLDDQAHIF